MLQLRDYQQQAVKAVLVHFRQKPEAAVLVLPTGAGKSLVIAELARLARGRVLVLAHVKELVEQNHAKYQSYGLEAAIFSASLGRKETAAKVVFASVQSVARNLTEFTEQYSLLVIDECHRVGDDEDSSYLKVIRALQLQNPDLKVLGLTATPYRLGSGWIYQYHSRGLIRTTEPRFFKYCIFDLPIRFLLGEGYLTPAVLMDAPVLSYDFAGLKPTASGYFKEADLDLRINQQQRATPQIIQQVIQHAQSRTGVMIFAATTAHAREILGYLPAAETALILGDTPQKERDALIQSFKQKQLKYLVNVAVLTTGFDAPHIDLIAILRPTESVTLYQQIVGRGLRLSPGKTDCLVLDYAGNRFNLEQPDIGELRPEPGTELVTVPCPLCGFFNNFWGKTDDRGLVLEHYGRRCQGYKEDEDARPVACGYRFKAKFCPDCGAENDIAARNCGDCGLVLVDPDKKLKEALSLKDALVLYVTRMQLQSHQTKEGKTSLKVSYFSADGAEIAEYWSLQTKAQKQKFLTLFVPPHLVDRHRAFTESSVNKVLQQSHRFQPPEAIIARKDGRFWQIRDKLFQIQDKDAN
jgi:DNA repair protein RadD